MRYRDNCHGVFVNDNGIITARAWTNAKNHFDNIFDSMLTIFEVLSLEGISIYPYIYIVFIFPTLLRTRHLKQIITGYIPILFNAMDVTVIGEAPKENNSPWFAIYFIFVIFIGCFFFLQLVISALLRFIFSFICNKKKFF